MTPDGVKCDLILVVPSRYIGLSDGSEPIVFTHNITIKSRPKHEMDLLVKWNNETPWTFFPPVSISSPFDEHFWYMKEMGEFEKVGYRQCNGNYIEIGDKKYNPWWFIREGNGKPPAVSCPTTAAGWKTLEDSLTPSTMRDEIKLVRMQLEYYGAEQKNKESKLKEMVSWLESLPSPQRMSMASSIDALSAVSRTNSETELESIKRLATDRKKLLSVVCPMMSFSGGLKKPDR